MKSIIIIITIIVIIIIINLQYFQVEVLTSHDVDDDLAEAGLYLLSESSKVDMDVLRKLKKLFEQEDDCCHWNVILSYKLALYMYTKDIVYNFKKTKVAVFGFPKK